MAWRAQQLLVALTGLTLPLVPAPTCLRTVPTLGYACAATKCEVAVEELCGADFHSGACTLCQHPGVPAGATWHRQQALLSGCSERYLDVLCANSNSSAKHFMTQVFDASLAVAPQWAKCKSLLAAGDHGAALREWRDQTLLLLARGDYLQFGWHSNVRATYSEDPVRVMVGNMTQAEEFRELVAINRDPSFVDLQGLRSINATHPLAAHRWFCNVSNRTLWPPDWPFKTAPAANYNPLKGGWIQYSSLAWAANQTDAATARRRGEYIAGYIERVRDLFQSEAA
eukprot:COSAG04_NODE_1531_length_6449_cov_3.075276_2_plen_284_part_00